MGLSISLSLEEKIIAKHKAPCHLVLQKRCLAGRKDKSEKRVDATHTTQ